MARKLLLEHINVPGINTLDVYRQKGGYRAVEKALKTLTPDEVVEEVKKSGLRGLGGVFQCPGRRDRVRDDDQEAGRRGTHPGTGEIAGAAPRRADGRASGRM